MSTQRERQLAITTIANAIPELLEEAGVECEAVALVVKGDGVTTASYVGGDTREKVMWRGMNMLLNATQRLAEQMDMPLELVAAALQGEGDETSVARRLSARRPTSQRPSGRGRRRTR